MIPPPELVQAILNTFAATAATGIPREIAAVIEHEDGRVYTIHVAFMRHLGTCAESDEVRPARPTTVHPNPSES